MNLDDDQNRFYIRTVDIQIIESISFSSYLDDGTC